MSIPANIAQIMENIQLALNKRRSKTTANNESVKLIAVTKNHDIQAMRTAIDAGITAIGENRLQEALVKHAELARQVEWHLIGHLQTNKVRQAVPLFDLIHSVDSERLAVEINRVAGKLNKRQDILLQVNVANEATKFGISPGETMALANVVSQLEHVRLRGLMTIAPFYEDREQTRPIFKALYDQFMELKAANLPNTKVELLSMGMTNDYIVAVEEGANLVRVGTGIFGARQY